MSEENLYILKNICDCSVDEQLGLLEIRNQPSIRSSMYLDHAISVDEHLGWISGLADGKKEKVFVVLKNGAKSVGALTLSRIDLLHKKTDWAVYLGENERGGLAVALEFAFINYVFEGLSFEKLNCEVIETNPAVAKLHKKFGFEEEGFRKSNVIKDGQRFGVHFLGLQRDDWMELRASGNSAIEKVVSKFDIRFFASS